MTFNFDNPKIGITGDRPFDIRLGFGLRQESPFGRPEPSHPAFKVARLGQNSRNRLGSRREAESGVPVDTGKLKKHKPPSGIPFAPDDGVDPFGQKTADMRHDIDMGGEPVVSHVGASCRGVILGWAVIRKLMCIQMAAITLARGVGSLLFGLRSAEGGTVVLCPHFFFATFAGFSGLSKIDNRRHGVYPL